MVSEVTVGTCGPCIFLAVPVESGGLGVVVSGGMVRGTNGVVGCNPAATTAMALFNVLQALLTC